MDELYSKLSTSMDVEKLQQMMVSKKFSAVSALYAARMISEEERLQLVNEIRAECGFGPLEIGPDGQSFSYAKPSERGI